MLKNKLGIQNSAELADVEERLTKKRAIDLYDSGKINDIPVGTYQGLSEIHYVLFQDLYDFAGQVRSENLAKGNFRFAPVLYLPEAIQAVDAMPHNNYQEIIAKYVEMNILHPFREGNGRSSRIWLDQMLKKALGQVVDWSKISKEDYLLAMERSPVKDLEINVLIANALTTEIDSRTVFMKGLDQSYAYEGYQVYSSAGLTNYSAKKDS
ncbi:Fic family protein [Leuconostocaceae bacterium ESL0958]|nr:Fic family protein [Leuconostocaceae bacterium ESL0958]